MNTLSLYLFNISDFLLSKRAYDFEQEKFADEQLEYIHNKRTRSDSQNLFDIENDEGDHDAPFHYNEENSENRSAVQQPLSPNLSAEHDTLNAAEGALHNFSR